MKFSLAVPLLALGVQQTLAVALPNFNGVRYSNGLKGRKGGNGGGNGGAKGGQPASTTSSSAPPAGTATTAAGGNANNAQTSLTLDPSQVQPNLANNGQAVPVAGQVASLTSTNNFINFCLTQNTALTNGQQVKTGSCNPTIMGRILATTNLPSSKFVFPTNNANIAVNTTFTIQMAIKNMVTGNFVNAQSNYYAAPCQVDSSGTVIGHSHVVVEAISAIDSTTVTDPNTFQFFKGLNAAAVNGILTADVTGGLPAGTYRLASINTCANHQPVLGSIAQHGSFDDMVYFTVGGAGGSTTTGTTGAANNAGGGGTVVATPSTPATASSSSAAAAATTTTTTTSAAASSTPATTGNKTGGRKGGKGGKGGAVGGAAGAVTASTSASVSAGAANAAAPATTTTTTSAAASATPPATGNGGKKGGKGGAGAGVGTGAVPAVSPTGNSSVTNTTSGAANVVAPLTTTTGGKGGKGGKKAGVAAVPTKRSAARGWRLEREADTE